MTVALPPVEAPAAIPIAQVPRHQKMLNLRFGSHQLHLIGFDDFDQSELEALVKTSPNAESLVVALTNQIYLRGDITSKVVYSLSGADLYIMPVKRSVRRVKGREDLQRFFVASAGTSEFDIGSFERSRILASTYADRAGLAVRPQFVPVTASIVDLDLRVTGENPPQAFSVSADISNNGSRFAGRNLLGLDLKGQSRSGFDAGLGYQKSILGSNSGDVRGNYQNASLHLGQVTAAGMFGVDLRRSQFSLYQPAPPLDGSYQEASIEWSDIVGASLQSRAMISVKFGYSDRDSTDVQSGADLFHETYFFAQVMPTYARSVDGGRVDAALTVVGGRAQSQNNSLAAENFVLARPILRYTWNQTDTYSLNAIAVGQWAGKTVPEFQQWTLGGADMMSAFVPATLFGDYGVFLRIGERKSWTSYGGFNYSAEPFVEYGTVNRRDPRAGTVSTGSAGDFGLALSAAWNKAVEFKASAAAPLRQPDTATNSRAGFYASLRVTY